MLELKFRVTSAASASLRERGVPAEAIASSFLALNTHSAKTSPSASQLPNNSKHLTSDDIHTLYIQLKLDSRNG